MRILTRSVTVALLLFVAATVGLLIAQEVARRDFMPIAEGPRSAGLSRRKRSQGKQFDLLAWNADSPAKFSRQTDVRDTGLIV